MSFESYHQSTINPASRLGYWQVQCVTCDWEEVIWSWANAIELAKNHWKDGRRD